MRTGLRGIFAISASQTETDGLTGADPAALRIGSVWSWRGEALRLDGPAGVLRLDGAAGEAALGRRAARRVRRLLGRGGGLGVQDDAPPPPPPAENAFTVTDGARRFEITVIATARGRPPLLLFSDALPPRDEDLHVIGVGPDRRARPDPERPADTAIGLAAGTRVATPAGARPVEALAVGDRVLTADAGPRPVLWAGRRPIGAARLVALPALRPLIVRPGGLGPGRPARPIRVAPAHRLVLGGPRVQALFGAAEVLVAARDLCDGRRLHVDHAARTADYVTLLLPSHHLLPVEGALAESLHPDAAGALPRGDRAGLHAGLPAAAGQAPPVRRILGRAEAAILLSAAA